MKIVILDAKTLGGDIDFGAIKKLGELEIYQTTSKLQLEERISGAEIIIVNKIKLNETNLPAAKKLKLICVTATGYDNIDVNYCWRKQIGVCNLKDYSTASVAQVTTAIALSLVTHLGEYDKYVKDGHYTGSGVQNRLKPYFHEIKGMTWGILGYGNIGGEVARIARGLGCNVLITPHRRMGDYDYFVSLDELMRKSDILSLHVPLTTETKCIINKKRLAALKNGAILINVSRGAVVDEAAVTEAVIDGKLGGLGVDVYTTEPLGDDSPYNRILDRPNVIFTPHMAWGAHEARVRCVEEIAKNIETFLMGGKRNRVDLK